MICQGGNGIPLGSAKLGSCKFFINWLSHLLVEASSFKQLEKVPSLSWSGRHWRRASRALVGLRKWQWFLTTPVLCDTSNALQYIFTKFTKWPAPSWLGSWVEYCYGIAGVMGSNSAKTCHEEMKLYDICIYMYSPTLNTKWQKQTNKQVSLEYAIISLFRVNFREKVFHKRLRNLPRKQDKPLK